MAPWQSQAFRMAHRAELRLALEAVCNGTVGGTGAARSRGVAKGRVLETAWPGGARLGCSTRLSLESGFLSRIDV